MLEQSKAIYTVSYIKTIDFPMLYTTLSNEQLKSRLSGLIRSTFIYKNGSRRYKYVVVKNNNAYLINKIVTPNKYSESDIVQNS